MTRGKSTTIVAPAAEPEPGQADEKIYVAVPLGAPRPEAELADWPDWFKSAVVDVYGRLPDYVKMQLRYERVAIVPLDADEFRRQRKCGPGEMMQLQRLDTGEYVLFVNLGLPDRAKMRAGDGWPGFVRYVLAHELCHLVLGHQHAWEARRLAGLPVNKRTTRAMLKQQECEADLLAVRWGLVAPELIQRRWRGWR